MNLDLVDSLGKISTFLLPNLISGRFNKSALSRRRTKTSTRMLVRDRRPYRFPLDNGPVLFIVSSDDFSNLGSLVNFNVNVDSPERFRFDSCGLKDVEICFVIWIDEIVKLKWMDFLAARNRFDPIEFFN